MKMEVLDTGSNTGVIKLYVDGVLTSTVTGTQNGTYGSILRWLEIQKDDRYEVNLKENLAQLEFFNLN